MAKDPAFLFYPGDWQLGTMHFTILEKGAYMELLMLQFARGKFTEAQAKHMLNGSFDLVWANVSEKFKFDGKFYCNERLEKEKERRAKFTESRRANGLAEKKKENNSEAYAKHTHKRMENENINENKEVNNNTITVKTNIEPTFNWGVEVTKFLQDSRWRETVCMSKNVKDKELFACMKEFTTKLTMQEDFKDCAGLKKHFINHITKHGLTVNHLDKNDPAKVRITLK